MNFGSRNFLFFIFWLYRVKNRVLFEDFNTLFSSVSPFSTGIISDLRIDKGLKFSKNS